MEEVELATGLSSSSLSIEPAENMVTIPGPAPGVVIHTLVPIVGGAPQEFIPPILHNLNPLQGLEVEMEHDKIMWARVNPALEYVEDC